MKEVLKSKTKKILIIVLIVLLSPIFIYLLIDGKNLYVDMYNFGQLQKVKFILKDLKRVDDQFFYLKDFNKIYNQKIEPIKNCYYLRNYKSEDRVKYTFGFKLESKIYKKIYGTEYYAYPKYDLPYQNVCIGGRGICEDEPEGVNTLYSQAKCEYNGECFDGNRRAFERIISNPCRE